MQGVVDGGLSSTCWRSHISKLQQRINLQRTKHAVRFISLHIPVQQQQRFPNRQHRNQVLFTRVNLSFRSGKSSDVSLVPLKEALSFLLWVGLHQFGLFYMIDFHIFCFVCELLTNFKGVERVGTRWCRILTCTNQNPATFELEYDSAHYQAAVSQIWSNYMHMRWWSRSAEFVSVTLLIIRCLKHL